MVVTHYEILVTDLAQFRRVLWQNVVFDGGLPLLLSTKYTRAKTAVLRLRSRQRVLVLGPPTMPGHGHVYNDSTTTLKALLQFVLPEVRASGAERVRRRARLTCASHAA